MHFIAKRTPAMEWAFWKALNDGAQVIDFTQIDHDKLAALSQHTELLKQLDRWILHPDKTLLPSLRALAKIVNDLYHFKELALFRGFDPSIAYQDTMGLQRGRYATGERHDYPLENPLSFSTELKIAQSFGPTVVRTLVDPNHPLGLVVTDELSVLVSQLRNIRPETQKEVIMFPPAVIQFTIIEK
jgi:hypothetical protein